MPDTFDIMIVGGGIAGASVAAHLSATHRVGIIEMEDRPGYHATGRSAAAYEPNYGPAPIRALTRAAGPFFWNPTPGFVASPILTPRETVFYMPERQTASFERLMRESVGLEEISLAEGRRKFPALREGFATRVLLDPLTADIDVDLLHQGYLRLLKSRSGSVICDAALTAAERSNGQWKIGTPAGTMTAGIIVNAAGAWGDKVAALAGARPVGLQPKRRSIAVIPGPGNADIMNWPLAGDAGETWYCKPQSGKLLVSPADATPVDPHDAYADDMTLAEGIERFQEAVDFKVTRVERTWGGLRTFAPDGNPVCGYDTALEGFFWLVGQGGYGIQTSPALSRLAAALVRHEPVPADILAEGLLLEDISPARFA